MHDEPQQADWLIAHLDDTVPDLERIVTDWSPDHQPLPLTTLNESHPHGMNPFTLSIIPPTLIPPDLIA